MRSKTCPSPRVSTTLSANLLGHAPRSPRGGGPCTDGPLPLRVLHGISQVLSLEPTTDPISLGIYCGTAQRRFYVPADILLKLDAILLEAIDSRSISFS